MASDIEAALRARWPENRIDPDIARMTALVDLLGDPQSSFPVIQVTGTNGKSSTTRMIEALLRAHGIRTGLYTSPHLRDIRERICLDGQPIDEERFEQAYLDVAPYCDLVDARSANEGGPALSFFEVLTAMAFSAFAEAPIDVAAVEVGLGGTWDATNVADAQVAVIAPIDLDHTELLGETREAIAGEKAGIIKPGAVAVIAEQTPEVTAVLRARADEVGATLLQQGIDFGVAQRIVALGGQQLTLRGLAGDYDEIFLPLFGEHQAANASLALAAVESFLGGERLDEDVVREAFATVSVPGRLEIVRRSPTIIVDAAHNPHGARTLAAAITDSFAFDRLVAVIAMLEGKDALRFIDAIGDVVDDVIITTNSSPRAMDADSLGAIAVEVLGDDRVEVVPFLSEAIARAVDLAEEEGDSSITGLGVLITGSVATVGDAMRLLKTERRRI